MFGLESLSRLNDVILVSSHKTTAYIFIKHGSYGVKLFYSYLAEG